MKKIFLYTLVIGFIVGCGGTEYSAKAVVIDENQSIEEKENIPKTESNTSKDTEDNTDIDEKENTKEVAKEKEEKSEENTKTVTSEDQNQEENNDTTENTKEEETDTGNTEEKEEKETIDPQAPIPRSGIYDESDEDEVKYLKVVNYARSIARECGEKGKYPAAPKLTLHKALYDAALEHNIDMAVEDYFDHVGSGKKSDITGMKLGTKSKFYERISENKYTQYSTLGENLALGYSSIELAVEGWLSSPGHCANLMNAKFKEMGLSKYEKNSVIYWTQNFGTRY